MAYGKGERRDDERRMVALGSMPTDDAWLALRDAYFDAANAIAAAVCLPLLDDLPKGKDLDRAMLQAQTGLKGSINSVWCEKARISAKAAVVERHKRGRRNLFGRLKHVDAVGAESMEDGTRRLVNLPEEWSRILSDADVAALRKLAATLDFAGAMVLLRKARDGRLNIPDLHVRALLALVDAAEAKFRHPTWGRDPQAIAQLHLDYRCISAKGQGRHRKAWTALQETLTAAMRQAARGGSATVVPLLVAARLARGEPRPVRALVRAAPLRHLVGDADPDGFEIGSLCLEIGPDAVAVKGVLSRKPKVRPWSETTHLVGRDFGYRNTVALAVVRRDEPVDEALLAEAKDWGKEEVRYYLEAHGHDGDAVETVLLDGADFLAAVAGHAKRVDALRSQIDRAYLRIHALKANVNARIGAAPDALVDLALDAGGDRHLAGWVKRLGRMLALVERLKVERRGVYRAVEGLKRSWFGYVSRVELDLARKWDAGVIREDLTVMAEEKGSPDYKGRTFNRMVNNGAKGQYIRRASDKLRWNGVPEAVVPSWWTSSTDVRTGTVDKAQRRGDAFVARSDGRVRHADLHAAQTLALWPILRPLPAKAPALAA